ncbi:hypothetical protein [Xenorhabdus bovienii]|uniref:hypothetical protein n=1 Tax=Xenorhabdus bovienii TaxID=40576 RepID=UPI0021577995|nr:hypothetical protein [Xenorhabdus bovienii]
MKKLWLWSVLVGDKRASQTLLKALMAYEPHLKEIDKLRSALRQIERERDEYKGKIERYRSAVSGLLD